MKCKLALMCLMSAGVSQVSMASPFSYNTLQLGYQSADVAVLGQSQTFDGHGVRAQVEFGNALYVFGQLEQSTSQDLAVGNVEIEAEVEFVSFGVGHFMPITSSSDLFFGLGFSKYTLEVGQLLNRDVDGFSVNGGVRTRLTQDVELEGAIVNTHLDGDSDTVASVALRYQVIPLIAPEIMVFRGDDTETISLGVQFRF